MSEDPLMRLVPEIEILELVRLASKIESPTVTYCTNDPLAMAKEAIANSKKNASAISDILYKWTH